MSILLSPEKLHTVTGPRSDNFENSSFACRTFPNISIPFAAVPFIAGPLDADNRVMILRTRKQFDPVHSSLLLMKKGKPWVPSCSYLYITSATVNGTSYDCTSMVRYQRECNTVSPKLYNRLSADPYNCRQIGRTMESCSGVCCKCLPEA